MCAFATSVSPTPSKLPCRSYDVCEACPFCFFLLCCRPENEVDFGRSLWSWVVRFLGMVLGNRQRGLILMGSRRSESHLPIELRGKLVRSSTCRACLTLGMCSSSVWLRSDRECLVLQTSLTPLSTHISQLVSEVTEEHRLNMRVTRIFALDSQYPSHSYHPFMTD